MEISLKLVRLNLITNIFFFIFSKEQDWDKNVDFWKNFAIKPSQIKESSLINNELFEKEFIAKHIVLYR